MKKVLFKGIIAVAALVASCAFVACGDKDDDYGDDDECYCKEKHSGYHEYVPIYGFSSCKAMEKELNKAGAEYGQKWTCE